MLGREEHEHPPAATRSWNTLGIAARSVSRLAQRAERAQITGLAEALESCGEVGEFDGEERFQS